MLELAPPIIATEQIDPQLRLLTLGAPGLAAAAQPGQFIAAQTSRPTGYGSIHRFGLPLARIDRDTGTVTVLLTATDQHSDVAQLRLGDTLNVLGPLGHGWQIAPQARQLLLVGTVASIASLLALAEAALRRHCAVTLILGGPIGPGLPAQLIPSAVEYHFGRGPDPVAAALDLLDAATLRWADAVYTTLPSSAWSSLSSQIERVRMRWERGFAQVAVALTVPCAVGVCGVCELPVGRKSKLLCVDGAVFDLRDLHS